MTQCSSCSGRATLFLCGICQSKLKDLLEHLPQWIIHLEEAAIGQVRLGDGGGGRNTARREPFKGDDEPPQGDPALLRRFLAAGRVNARASTMLDAVHNSLSTWVRHICEHRGIAWMPLRSVGPGFIGPVCEGWRRLPRYYIATGRDMAEWLAWNVGAIACDESAGECLAELEDHVRAIEKVINRPLPMRDLGNCPTWNEHTRRACGTELSCRKGVVQVTCPNCRQTHNPDQLQLLRMNDLMRFPVPWENILKANKTAPEGFQVDERTLRKWRSIGPKGEPPKLKVRGYRRPDGSRMINRHSDDDVPLYLWSDVTRARSEKPERAARVVKTG